MAETVASKCLDQLLPPVASGDGAYDVKTTGASAQTSLWANLTQPKGYCWLEFQNIDATDSIYFFLATSATGTVTADNGYKLTPGSVVRFWVAPKYTHVVNLASANTPKLKWRVCSPLANRTDQA